MNVEGSVILGPVTLSSVPSKDKAPPNRPEVVLVVPPFKVATLLFPEESEVVLPDVSLKPYDTIRPPTGGGLVTVLFTLTVTPEEVAVCPAASRAIADTV